MSGDFFHVRQQSSNLSQTNSSNSNLDLDSFNSQSDSDAESTQLEENFADLYMVTSDEEDEEAQEEEVGLKIFKITSQIAKNTNLYS